MASTMCSPTGIYVSIFTSKALLSIHILDIMCSIRYMLFSTLLGSVYSLLQTLISIFQLAHGTNGNLVLLDFYGDLVILYALVTGASAGFNVPMDLTRVVQVEGNNNVHERFLVDKVNAAATFVLLGSICSSISLVLSTFDLRNRCLNSFRCYMMKVKRFFN
uniref:CASP-like protein n=1 Tax=Kalanchoe fedtschenkoi TaxID=63787 RepID=A0A7N1A4V4_KALFE